MSRFLYFEFTVQWQKIVQTLSLDFCWHHTNTEIKYYVLKRGWQKLLLKPSWVICAATEDSTSSSLPCNGTSVPDSTTTSLPVFPLPWRDFVIKQVIAWQRKAFSEHLWVKIFPKEKKESHSSCLLYNLVLKGSSTARSPHRNSVPHRLQK